jgi:hypothetical protein
MCKCFGAGGGAGDVAASGVSDWQARKRRTKGMVKRVTGV